MRTACVWTRPVLVCSILDAHIVFIKKTHTQHKHTHTHTHTHTPITSSWGDEGREMLRLSPEAERAKKDWWVLCNSFFFWVCRAATATSQGVSMVWRKLLALSNTSTRTLRLTPAHTDLFGGLDRRHLQQRNVVCTIRPTKRAQPPHAMLSLNKYQ